MYNTFLPTKSKNCFSLIMKSINKLYIIYNYLFNHKDTYKMILTF